MENREIKIGGNVSKLLQKISKISENISSIPKNGLNTTFGYNYVTERDVVETLRTVLHKEGVVLIPSVVSTTEREILNKGGDRTTITKVRMSYTFLDAETGGYLTTYFEGEGEDAYDKGIYKAITGCQKYALLKTFLIPTGDDPENEGERNTCNPNYVDNPFANNDTTYGFEDPFSEADVFSNDFENTPDFSKNNAKISSQKAKQIFALAKGNKHILSTILNKYGYNTSFEITVKDVAQIENEIRKAV